MRAADQKIGKVTGKGKKKPDNLVELYQLDKEDQAAVKRLEGKGFKIIYPHEMDDEKIKYQNVSEVLKYVESEGGSGEGIKLVIMNFND